MEPEVADIMHDASEAAHLIGSVLSLPTLTGADLQQSIDNLLRLTRSLKRAQTLFD